MPSYQEMEERIRILEDRLEKALREQEKIKRDLRFFEYLLLEQYEILLQLIGKERGNIQIHRK